MNQFLLEDSEYTRAVNPIQDWIKQTSLYLSKISHKPYEEVRALLISKLKNKEIVIKDPIVKFFQRDETGDRAPQQAPLSEYIRSTLDENDILVPTFTTYTHPTVQSSMIVGYMDSNKRNRSINKKKAHEYESKGDMIKASYYQNLQNSNKTANNSCSGCFVNAGNILHNTSGHSSLTSTIRSIASLSNASNERLIFGNRHYYNPQVTLNNLISIVSESDLTLIQQVIEQEGLKYPSLEETISCIKYSSDLYWRGDKLFEPIYEFLVVLSDAERAAIVYIGDLYHLRKYNDTYIRKLIGDLSNIPEPQAFEDPIPLIYQIDEQIINYTHQALASELEGKGKDYKSMPLLLQQKIITVAKNIELTVKAYYPLFKAFFLTRNSPPVISNIQLMIRRSVVLSDTDSTMFSVDDWNAWYFGQLDFSDKGYAVSGAVMFIATQSIAHLLAIFSANMGVEQERLHVLAMKPEFVFPIFAQTSIKKHYYTCIYIKEGNVYPKLKMEIKGVHLKDSTISKPIIEEAQKDMEQILLDVYRGNRISLKYYLDKYKAMEREIIRSLEAGEMTYLQRVSIKEAKSYKKEEEESPYQYYEMWNRTFGLSYGASPPPPYEAVRLPLDVNLKISEIKERIEYSEKGRLFINYLIEKGRSNIGGFPIPLQTVLVHGIPEELLKLLDIKTITLNTTKAQRNILESLGFFPKNEFLLIEHT
jgi:hypothetical protein